MANGRTSGLLQIYIGRLGFYATTTLLFSAAGSVFTWRETSVWVDANPVVSGPIALLSLLPAIAIVAVIRVKWAAALLVSGGAASTMLLFWWLFASSDSSTASLVFLLGWFPGVPLAVVATIIVRLRQLASTPPAAPMPEDREIKYRFRVDSR
ncbi:MAG: hypothetical protein AAF962_14230 [Actinomycetota bacterium]